MKTEQNAVQESPEEIEARLKQEAIDSGEEFEPSGTNLVDLEPAKKDDAKPQAGDAIDADFLESLAGDEKPKMIPHARFNEVNEESKARAARIQELELALARMEGKAEAVAPKEGKKDDAPKAFDFDAAEDLYSEAILNGDPTKAKAIRAEIRKEEQASYEARAEALADKRYDTRRAEDDAKRTKLEFDLELNKAYEAYPFLNTESAEPNANAIEEVFVWTQHFLNKGKTSAEALAAAVAKVGPAHAPKDESQPAKIDPPKVDVKLGLERAAKVPAKPEGVGERASQVDISKMSAKDIKALPSDVEARLAGDMV